MGRSRLRVRLLRIGPTRAYSYLHLFDLSRRSIRVMHPHQYYNSHIQRYRLSMRRLSLNSAFLFFGGISFPNISVLYRNYALEI